MPRSRTLRRKTSPRPLPPARRAGQAIEAEARLLALARELTELPAEATLADVVGRLGGAHGPDAPLPRALAQAWLRGRNDQTAALALAWAADQGRPQQRVTGAERALRAEAACPPFPLAAGLHHRDVQLDRAPHVARPAAAALEQAVEARREHGELLGRHVRGLPAVGEPGDERERARPHGGDPQWRARALERGRRQPRGAQAKDGPVGAHALAAPQRAHDRERLADGRHPRFARRIADAVALPGRSRRRVLGADRHA